MRRKQEQTFRGTSTWENNPGMFRMSNTTFTSSDESSRCSALRKHLRQEGGRESQQDWEGMCIASDEWHNAQAAAAQMPKVGPLLLQLDPSWSFELQMDTSLYGILLQHGNAETACYMCLFHSEIETLMGNVSPNSLAQQLKNIFQHFCTRPCRN